MVELAARNDIGQDEATVNITWNGENGELPNTVLYDTSDAELRRWATEAIRGGIPGITADADVDLTDFVVERFAATADLPNRVIIRPKTPFGRVKVALDLRGWEGLEVEFPHE